MLPKDFVSPFPGLEEALEQEPSVSVRVNKAKGAEVPADARRIPWCDTGFWLDNRIPFTWDPAMHQGLYYVQDSSSMIAAEAVRRASEMLSGGTPLLLLDSCAAPGGKSTAAIAALPAGSMVVANEYVPQRVAVLSENLAKWGSPAVAVTRGDTAQFRKTREMFDIIIADVPCSGEGMFRKDPEAVRQWTPALVEECAVRQREIVDNLWEALRPGGILIYSTCTFNRSENQEMRRYILDTLPEAEPIEFSLPEEWGTVEVDGCTHFVPGRIEGEGLTIFMASKGKPEPRVGQVATGRPRKERGAKGRDEVPPECKKWIKGACDYEFTVTDGEVRAIPSRWSAVANALTANVRTVSIGVDMATIKGRDAIPSQALALSTALNTEAFPTVAVDYPTAAAYLRRDAVTLPEGTPRGFVLLAYGNRPLGFVKNIGNRSNNLYPQEWRILSTHIPDSAPTLL